MERCSSTSNAKGSEGRRGVEPSLAAEVGDSATGWGLGNAGSAACMGARLRSGLGEDGEGGVDAKPNGSVGGKEGASSRLSAGRRGGQKRATGASGRGAAGLERAAW